MAFACQRNSFQTELTTKVISCNQLPGKQEQYEVILEDTILFPEGGGQPDDRGTVGGIHVSAVRRIGGKAVHLVDTALKPHDEVQVVVDWTRRFDHMQQHTGQHLVTAIADMLFGFKTTSWNLGEKLSFIELDTPTVNEDQVFQLEKETNEKILESKAVNVITVEGVDSDNEALREARTRGLPSDVAGPIRLIQIQDVDTNMCCGTHLSNLSQLQAVKLLWTEKGKKGKTNLYFVSGGRVLSYLHEAVQREKKITAVLKCGPVDHAVMAEKTVKSAKSMQKDVTNLLRDLAKLEIEKTKTLDLNTNNIFCLHRKEGDFEFMNTISTNLMEDIGVVFVSVGDEKESGQFVLTCSKEVAPLDEVARKVCEIIGGKGAVKHGKFTGRTTALKNRNKVEKYLSELVGQTKTQ